MLVNGEYNTLVGQFRNGGRIYDRSAQVSSARGQQHQADSLLRSPQLAHARPSHPSTGDRRMDLSLLDLTDASPSISSKEMMDKLHAS